MLVRVSEDNIIERVKVVTGETLALLDTTGTLTQKYQARLVLRQASTELITTEDTERLKPLTDKSGEFKSFPGSPIDQPQVGFLLPIQSIFDRLKTLVGMSFADMGSEQERNRGAQLHGLVCSALG